MALEPSPSDGRFSLEIAIVGGGIAGVTLAAGLLARGMSVKIYERASGLHEIGAGIGMSPNAERAMLALDPRVHTAFKDVATPNTEDWFQYVDGYHCSADGDGEDLLFKVYLGTRGFEGCRRSDLLDGLAKLVPDGCLEYDRELVDISEPPAEARPGERVTLRFRDGSTAESDLVLGCDGLRSRVRQHVLGPDHPAVQPSYTHKFAFRGLIPMARARKCLSEDKASTRYMHLGPGGHALTFPVAMGTMLNVVAFATSPDEWPDDARLTLPATRDEAVAAFAGFGPVVRAIMGMLDDKLDKWAVFDTFDNPVPRYVSAGGRVCLVGDAAHAAAPHHGAGAGFAIEDALALAVALEDASREMMRGGQDAGTATDLGRDSKVLRAALGAYEAVRYERTRWLVETSRFVGELYEWQVAECGSDAAKCLAEVESRCHRIWDYDVDDMVRQTREIFQQSLGTSSVHKA